MQLPLVVVLWGKKKEEKRKNCAVKKYNIKLTSYVKKPE